MAVTELAGVDALLGAVGQHLGSSDWVTVTEDRVRAFGVATGDTAAPGNGAVAPANLILSLSNMLLPQILEVTGISAGVNYGAGDGAFSRTGGGGQPGEGPGRPGGRRPGAGRGADHHRHHDRHRGPGRTGVRDRGAQPLAGLNPLRRRRAPATRRRPVRHCRPRGERPRLLPRAGAGRAPGRAQVGRRLAAAVHRPGWRR